MSVHGGGRRKVVCQVPGFLQDDVVPYFHITPFLARRRRNIMNLNPMAHGTENSTQSVYHPVVDLSSRRLCLTRLQVVSKIVDLKSITRTLPKRPLTRLEVVSKIVDLKALQGHCGPRMRPRMRACFFFWGRQMSISTGSSRFPVARSRTEDIVHPKTFASMAFL